MGVLSELNPKHVWKHFENMCNIPHPSLHEEQIAAYVIEEAEKLGFAVRRDEVGNVLVTVPATPGHEHAPIVVLQGHLDMVPVAAPGVTHDFTKDPIQPYIDGDFVRARGTTLGADNGIGGAIMLGIMEDKSLEHGPLELLFTVNEESGMDGAHGLKADFVKGRMLINLDTEEFGQYYISCAGGGDSIIKLPLQRETGPVSGTVLTIKAGGLKGGHSGVDINLGRGSGNKIMARCLAAGWDVTSFRLVALEGGNKRNSIADAAKATVIVPQEKLAAFQASLANIADLISAELAKTDPGFTFEITQENTTTGSLKPVTIPDSGKIINLLMALPHGVIAMSPEVPGLVETSTNVGVMSTEEDLFKTTLLTRSAVTSQLMAVKRQIRAVADLVGADVEEPRGYPGWKPDMNSPLLKTAMKVFEDMHHRVPEVKAIHAGLECGLFSEKLPGVDMLSIGPEMHNVHSPAEELNHPSVPKTYELLTAILKALV